MTKTIRFDIDTQHDFCRPNGALYVKGAEEVIPLVARLNTEAQAHGIPLFGSVDTHIPHDMEFKQYGGPWPSHCVKGTEGWLKSPTTLLGDFRFIPDSDEDSPYNVSGDAVLYSLNAMKGRVFYFEKSLYSFLANPYAVPTIDALVQFSGYKTFEVYGVATDYCVKEAVLGLRERWPSSRVRVVLDACRGVAKDTTEAAIREMQEAGAVMVTMADVAR